MPILLTLLIGGLAGVLAARLMGLKTDVFVSMAIGVIGALIGGVALRFLVGLFAAAASSFMSIFIGGLIGALALIWIYRTFNPPR
ncbi:MAG: GlsB/YeaQ/YmgE family stress response membrane protein [Pseudomonadota bacterium]